MSENKTVSMPSRLTAENGAKGLLCGEYSETIEIVNPEFDGYGDEETFVYSVPVSWSNIKDIYAKCVDYFAKEPLTESQCQESLKEIEQKLEAVMLARSKEMSEEAYDDFCQLANLLDDKINIECKESEPPNPHGDSNGT